jgi:hypothetical protein
MVEKSEGRRAGSSLRLKTIEKLAGRLYIQYVSAAGIEDGGFHFIRDVSRGLSTRNNASIGYSPEGIYTQLHVLKAHQRTGCLKMVAKVSMIINRLRGVSYRLRP